jgi:hypothetical protein
MAPKVGRRSGFIPQSQPTKKLWQLNATIRICPWQKWIGSIGVLLFLCGCSTDVRHPAVIGPTTVQPIRLAHDQTVSSGRRVILVHAGVFKAEFQDDAGIYYHAPLSMDLIKPKPWPLSPEGPGRFLHGGLFIPDSESEDQRHAVWVYHEFVIPMAGKIIPTRPLQMFFLKEKIVHE